MNLTKRQQEIAETRLAEALGRAREALPRMRAARRSLGRGRTRRARRHRARTVLLRTCPCTVRGDAPRPGPALAVTRPGAQQDSGPLSPLNTPNPLRRNDMHSQLHTSDVAEPAIVQAPPEPFTTTFTFDWTKAPLSMNDRMHHIVHARIVADLRARMHAEARFVPELERIEVRLVQFVNTRRRRDDENLVATLKPLCDGLVDAEIVPDDTREFMLKHMPEIRYEKGCTPHFEFTVSEVTA